MTSSSDNERIATRLSRFETELRESLIRLPMLEKKLRQALADLETASTPLKDREANRRRLRAAVDFINSFGPVDIPVLVTEKRRRGRPAKALKDESNKPNLTKAQWLAANADFSAWRRDSKLEFGLTGGQVALKAGVTPQIISRWRRLPKYRSALAWLGAQELASKLEAKDKNRRGPPKRTTQRQWAIELDVYVRRNWTGPVQSIIDGKWYATVDEYVAHLLKAKVSPPNERSRRRG